MALEITNLEDLLRIDRVIICLRKGQNVSFMACPLCDYFPCNQLSDEMIQELNRSPLMDRSVKKLIPRRCKLFIIKYLDGTLKEAPELNPNSPDRELMKDVDTVYQTGKEFIPVIVLKPKPKEDRNKIIKATQTKDIKKVGK